ncbi:MAG: tripartite tricarboxylate transporter substrate-binding protein [Alphaproteobacteria bacterium]
MKLRTFLWTILGALLVVPVLGQMASPATDNAPSEFYKKNRLIVVVGYNPGGGFDRGGRVVARHIVKYIPGKPKVIVRNMPGAGSMRSLNWLYTVAPKDGSVIGHFHPAALREPFLGGRGPKYDPRKFYHIGSYNRERSVTFVRADSGIKTIQDAMKKEVIIGATSPRSGGGVYPMLLNNLLGTKFKVIVGYGGTGESTLAMERGEIQGVGSWSWSQLKMRKAKWLKDKFVNVLIQLSIAKHPDLPNIPTPLDLAETEEDRQVIEAIFMWQEMGRPFAAPPGTDPVHGAALRKAFDTMVTKDDFKKGIERASLEVNALSAKGVEKLLDKLYSYPQKVIDRGRTIYAEMRSTKLSKAKKKKAKGLKLVTVKAKGKRVKWTFKDAKGKTWKFKTHDRRTKVKVGGKKAKRKDVKIGMTCSVSYYGEGGLAYNTSCK